MQNIILYVSAANTLGAVRDYANAQSVAAPVLTRDVAVRLKLRLFATGDGMEPYPVDELRQIAAWQFVIDDDFDVASNCVLVADHAQIAVNEVTESILDTEYRYTEISIPIPEMNTEELAAALGTAESIGNLNGELVGFDATGKAAFLLQIKGFTVRNRITSIGTPTVILPDYLNETQVRALCAAGMEFLFAESASEIAADWHTEQGESDKFFRLRLKGDARNWTSGDAATSGWSDPIGLLTGPVGAPGEDGICVYTYVAFATDAEGSGFTMNPAERTNAHRFLAFCTTQSTAATATDFAGKWVKFILDDASNISIAGMYFQGSSVEAALQEIGSTLHGMEELLSEI